MLKLLALINEQMWLGHFDIWPQEGVVMFRHALVLAGGATASDRQCEAILDAAMDAVDRYYPAFQFVVGRARARGTPWTPRFSIPSEEA